MSRGAYPWPAAAAERQRVGDFARILADTEGRSFHGGEQDMRTLLILISLAVTGCAVTPTDVRQSTPTRMYERPGGPVANVADCFGKALERDLGLETVVRQPRPSSAEVSAWGASDRRTLLVVTLDDRHGGGMRVAVFRNPHALFCFHPEPVIEESLATCTPR
jgi:hypothetical protein